MPLSVLPLALVELSIARFLPVAIALIILEVSDEFHTAIFVPFRSFAVSFILNPETVVARTADLPVIIQSSMAMS